VGCRERGSCLLASSPRGGRAATRVVRQRSTPARQGEPPAKRQELAAGRARGGTRRRLAARCGWLLQAAGNTFVRPGVAPCLAAYVAVGAPVVWRSQCSGRALSQRFAARNRAAHRTGRYPDETKTSGKRECSGQWSGQQGQQEEVWIERSQLGHVLRSPTLR